MDEETLECGEKLSRRVTSRIGINDGALLEFGKAGIGNEGILLCRGQVVPRGEVLPSFFFWEL